MNKKSGIWFVVFALVVSACGSTPMLGSDAAAPPLTMPQAPAVEAPASGSLPLPPPWTFPVLNPSEAIPPEIARLFEDAEGWGETQAQALEEPQFADPNQQKPDCGPQLAEARGIVDRAKVYQDISGQGASTKFVTQYWVDESGAPLAKVTLIEGDPDAISRIVYGSIHVYEQFQGKKVATELLIRINNEWVRLFGADGYRRVLHDINGYPWSCYSQRYKSAPAHSDQNGEHPAHWFLEIL